MAATVFLWIVFAFQLLLRKDWTNLSIKHNELTYNNAFMFDTVHKMTHYITYTFQAHYCFLWITFMFQRFLMNDWTNLHVYTIYLASSSTSSSPSNCTDSSPPQSPPASTLHLLQLLLLFLLMLLLLLPPAFMSDAVHSPRGSG